MAEGLQPELARVRQPLGKSLRLGFDHQVILPVTERASQVSTKRDFSASQAILRRVVDIDAGYIRALAAAKWFTWV